MRKPAFTCRLPYVVDALNRQARNSNIDDGRPPDATPFPCGDATRI
jgi:hypothetical protein